MDDKLSVDREVMDQFVYRSRDGWLIMTDLGFACVREFYGFDENYQLQGVMYRDPTNQNRLMFQKGPSEPVFLIYTPTYPSSVNPWFEPKSFGEAMVRCLKGEEEMDVAMELEEKGLDKYMLEEKLGKFLRGPKYKPYRQQEAGRAKTRRNRKRRSTRRKHTLVKRRNVRVNRFRTLKA
jgi:hypothetical protein